MNCQNAASPWPRSAVLPRLRGARGRRAGHAALGLHVVGDVMQAVVTRSARGRDPGRAGAHPLHGRRVEMDSTMKGGLLGGLKRMVGGEILFRPGSGAAPGRWPLPRPPPGSSSRSTSRAARVAVQRIRFPCANAASEIGSTFTKRFGAGPVRRRRLHPQRIGGNGTAFIHGGGNFIEFDSCRQTLRVDTDHRRFDETVPLRHPVRGGIQERALRRRGPVPFATLSGPEVRLLQTLPFSRLAGRIMGLTREGTGGVAGVKGTLRDIGNIFGGDE